ncbi:MAG TPA: sigma factor-like helix-turn-helix DNA-binding protein [Actinomycetota bacterium]|nr:sigma factor-like helix-turn-helix DNA-binding protein [Actinomycetota bacterium]
MRPTSRSGNGCDALLALPVRQRTAVVLRYFEDLSEAQTADVMRLRKGAVKSLVSRGTTTLRTMLGEDR